MHLGKHNTESLTQFFAGYRFYLSVIIYHHRGTTFGFLVSQISQIEAGHISGNISSCVHMPVRIVLRRCFQIITFIPRSFHVALVGIYERKLIVCTGVGIVLFLAIVSIFLKNINISLVDISYTTGDSLNEPVRKTCLIYQLFIIFI